MSWEEKYLTIYEQSFESVDDRIKEEIKEKLGLHKMADPTVTIAVIAHNEENRIAACLWSLCDNVCSFPYEIIVINNNSTDRTTDVLTELDATWFDEIKKGPGFARNCGLDHAQGKFYICADSDSIYPPQYIETHMKELIKSDVACSYALWSFLPDEKHPAWQLHIYECLRDLYLRIQNIKRPELNVRGMTFAFKTDLGKKLRFRTDLIRGEDGSLALAMKSYGKLKFITDKKARIYTDNGTMNADGTMMQSFLKRFSKGLRNAIGLTHSKEKYQDKDSNIIKG